jgi:hypothetical protein
VPDAEAALPRDLAFNRRAAGAGVEFVGMGATMRDDEAAVFARSVVSWFAGEIDRAVLETQLVGAPAPLPVEAARRNLLEVQYALLAIERAFAGAGDEETTGELLAAPFCVQIVMGMLALSEWQALELAGQRGQA